LLSEGNIGTEKLIDRPKRFSSFYFPFQFFSIKEILLSIVFVLDTEMKHLKNDNKKKNNNNTILAAAKVFSFATILVVAAIGVTTMAPLTALASRSGGLELLQMVERRLVTELT
jgi:hypothetical protein